MYFPALCPHISSPAADEHLKRQIRWLLFLRVLFLSLVLGLSVLLQSKSRPLLVPSLHTLAWSIAGLYLFSIVSALALQVIRCYRRFGYLQIGVDTMLVTLLVFASGGSQSVFTVAYFLPIVMGASMLFQRGGTLFAAVSTLLYGSLLVIEYNGLAPVYLPKTESALLSVQLALHFFAIHGITFFLVALLASFLSARLQRTEAALFQTVSNYDRLSFLYKRIFEDVSTGIITTDSDNLITSFNPAAERITGYGAELASGQRLNHLFPELLPAPDDGERRSATVTRRDGVPIPVGYSWSRLRAEDDSGNQHVCTIQDLSQIKKMEVKLRQAEKMATIGEMAAGIAHELRNPLAAISGAAQMLDREAIGNPTNQRLFRIITRESDRLDATIHEFLLFARPTTPDRKWFCLKEAGREAVETLAQNPAWSKGITVELDIDEALRCWGDPQLIRQALINLVSNSANACGVENQGRIVLSARENSPEDGAGATVTISVQDNGPGIPEEVLPKIFEPFFTTRENGTGLGLAIVRQIVENHEGTIDGGNNDNGGAYFEMNFPLP